MNIGMLKNAQSKRLAREWRKAFSLNAIFEYALASIGLLLVMEILFETTMAMLAIL